MAKFCTQCGGALTAGARFCGSCGASTDPVLGNAVPFSVPVEVSVLEPNVAVPIYEPVASEPRAARMETAAPAFAPETPVVFEEVEQERKGPNWLLIGGGVLIAALLLGYYIIFIRDDIPANPAGPGPVASQDAQDKPAEAKQYYTVADANIRDKPTAQGSTILGKMPRGSALSGTLALGEDGISEWLTLADDKGFIGAVNLSETQPPVIAKKLGDKIWRADKALEIWAQPSATAAIVDRVAAGTPLTLFGMTGNNYIEIKLQKGGVGYLADGSRIAALGSATGKPITISFNPSTCNFGGELEAEFEKLGNKVRAVYTAADKADYPSDEAREKILGVLEGKSHFQPLQRSFNGLSITAIGQHYESQSVYFSDAAEKVISVFNAAGVKVGKDGSIPSSELFASIGKAGSDGRKFGASELSCGV